MKDPNKSMHDYECAVTACMLLGLGRIAQSMTVDYLDVSWHMNGKGYGDGYGYGHGHVYGYGDGYGHVYGYGRRK